MDADDNCYIVGKPYKSPKDGSVTLAKKSYYTKLSDALENVLARAVRDKVANGTLTELSAVIHEQDRLRIELSTLLNAMSI